MTNQIISTAEQSNAAVKIEETTAPQSGVFTSCHESSANGKNVRHLVFHDDNFTDGNTSSSVPVVANIQQNSQQVIDTRGDLLVDSFEKNDKDTEKEVQEFFEYQMTSMDQGYISETMTNVTSQFYLSSSQIKNFQDSRIQMFKRVPKFHPSDQVTDISDMIISFADYLKKVGVYEIIHYFMMTRVLNNSHLFIVNFDSELLMAELVNAANLTEDEKTQILQPNSLKIQLLLFFDKLYPVYDFINWFEANYEHYKLDFQTCFTYYVFKNLTFTVTNYENERQKLDNILSECNKSCKAYMKESYSKIFEGHPIINKFYVFGSNYEHLQNVFTQTALDKNTVDSERIIKSQVYAYNKKAGIHKIFPYQRLASANIALHNGHRNHSTGIKNNNHRKNKKYGNPSPPTAYNTSFPSGENRKHPKKPKKNNQRNNTHTYGPGRNNVYLNDEASSSESEIEDIRVSPVVF